MADNENIGDKLPIQEFTLDEMVINPSIIMIAKRGSGKSWITKAIVHKCADIPVGIVISPTEKDNPFFSDFFPDTFIFYKYESKILRKLLIRQKLILKKAREKKLQGKLIDPRAIVVMDDCLASKGVWAKDPLVSELLFNGRHRQITYILTMQYPLGISPELRSNFDYVFLLAEDTTSNLKRIYEHYAGMFPDFNSFRQVFRQLTEDFGAMVIKNRGSRTNLFDKIAFYKAPDLKKVPLKFGCNQFRTYHKKNYKEDWEEKAFQLDYDEFLLDKKKSKSRIDVKKVFKDDA
ncbi:packaging ATPase [Yasminevirus sp. GU-2018]|uniref:Packaging ATPase n=1 Tax=Yasminevirus sp. GU-2018 TaxID=2420051 RepID=A0A5K0U7X0_9VIRU|nr:packaging ATPase [Yasminevirus sp. GU-2018]